MVQQQRVGKWINADQAQEYSKVGQLMSSLCRLLRDGRLRVLASAGGTETCDLDGDVVKEAMNLVAVDERI